MISTFAQFVDQLLREGCASLKAAPERTARADQEVLAILEQAGRVQRLAVAGPPIAFDERSALAAASLVHWSCWLLVDHSQPATAIEELLRMPQLPETPSQHASADLMLRYLPQVHRRAAAVNAAEPLARVLAKVLRQWPLSGVLSDEMEEPLTTLHFSGHHGLLWLYAERWVQRQKPAWLPVGRGSEHLEAVWLDMGKDIQFLRRMLKVDAPIGENSA